MRGDGGHDNDIVPDTVVELSRLAYQLKKPDAKRRATEALDRAKRAGDRDQASALSKILGEHRNRRLADVDEGPLPELVVQSRSRRGDAIEALISNGSLEWRHEAAALSIASVVEALTSPLAVRAASWERGRVDGRGNGALAMPERLAGLYTDRYKPWAA